MKEKLKFYLRMIGHIMFDGVFLILWAAFVYLIHEEILPSIHLTGFLDLLINAVAELMEACIGIPIVIKIIIDTINEVRLIIYGKNNNQVCISAPVDAGLVEKGYTA